MRRGEMLIALSMIGMSIAAWISSSSFVAETAMVRTLSPALYPRLLLVGISFCAVLLLVRAFRGRTGEGAVAWGQRYKVPLATGVMFLQVFTFEELGVFPSAWIALMLLMWITRVPLRMRLLVCSGFLVFVYLFFILLLRLRLPMEFLPTLFVGD